jgi:hypothetical protein
MLRHMAAAAVVCCFPALAPAGPLTFQFLGRISQVPIDDAYGNINVGDPIFGNFTFETTAADGDPGDPHIGSYQSPAGLPYVFNVSFSGDSFSASDSLNIGVFHAAVDQYSVLALNNQFSESISIFLQDSSGGVFSNKSLPLNPPPLASFDISPVAFSLDITVNSNETQANGYIDSLTCSSCTTAPAPEPSTTALLGCALAWALLRAARKRNRQRREL